MLPALAVDEMRGIVKRHTPREFSFDPGSFCKPMRCMSYSPYTTVCVLCRHPDLSQPGATRGPMPVATSRWLSRVPTALPYTVISLLPACFLLSSWLPPSLRLAVHRKKKMGGQTKFHAVKGGRLQ
jgi:hypothetical protein